MLAITNRRIVIAGLYATLLLPLLFTPFTYFPWHFGKTVIFQMLVEALLVASLIAGRQKKNSSEQFTMHAADVVIVFFLSLMVVASIFGINTSRSWWGSESRIDGVFTWLHLVVWYFLVRIFVSTPAERRRFVGVALGVGILVSVSILLQKYVSVAWKSDSGGGIIGNRGFAGSYLTALLGLGLYSLYLNFKQSLWRYGGIVAVILSLTAVWSDENRGALLGICAGVVVGVVVAIATAREQKLKRIFLGVLAGVCVLGVALFALTHTDFGKEQFPRLVPFFSLSTYTSGTAETRLLAWQVAAEAIKAHPFFGWGPGNFQIIFDTYYNPSFLRFSFAETVWDKPHNWFLEIATSTGLLGLASYATIFATLFFSLIKQSKKESSERVLPAIFIGAFVGYLAQSFFLFETINALQLFFLLLALAVGGIAVPGGVGVLGWNLNSVHTKLSSRFSIVIVTSLVGLSYLFVQSTALRASYYMQKAIGSSDIASWAEWSEPALKFPVWFNGESAVFLAQNFFERDKSGQDVNSSGVIHAAERVAEVLIKEADAHPREVAYPQWAGQVYMVLGEKVDQKYYAEAEKALQTARALSPKKQELLFLLGRLYLLEKKFPEALQVQKDAVAVAPEIHVSHWFLGLAYVAAGQTEEGLAEIERAKQLGFAPTTDQTLYIIDLYAGLKKYDTVIKYYQDLQNSEPENVSWYVKLATVYAVVGRKAEALQMVKQAEDLYPPIKNDADAFIKQYKLQ